MMLRRQATFLFHSFDDIARRPDLHDLHAFLCGDTPADARSLYERLVDLGYRALPKYLIGEFEVDFLINGHAATKAVISCDGDRIASEHSVLAKMERQLTLERLGWNFIRVRASDYLMDESRAMRRIVRKLGSAKIEPVSEGQSDASPGVVREDLREKIFKRAEMIRSRWKA